MKTFAETNPEESRMLAELCTQRAKKRGRNKPLILDMPKPIKADIKVGRNDPCPCNSGKKFKKCCGV